MPLFVQRDHDVMPTPALKAEVPVIRCSPPAPLVVMAKRTRLVLPFCGVRNIYIVVLLPKSKMRVQLAVEFKLHPCLDGEIGQRADDAGGQARRIATKLDASVNWPLENVPPLGSVPFHTGAADGIGDSRAAGFTEAVTMRERRSRARW